MAGTGFVADLSNTSLSLSADVFKSVLLFRSHPSEGASLPRIPFRSRTKSQENLYGRNMNGSNRIRLLRAQSADNAVEAEALATKAVGYIRVSTEEQAANGHGLNIQARAIRSFAESQGYTLIDVVSEPGVSGAKRPEERSGFQKIIELAKARKFSMLLLWKFDRLARNLLFSVTTVHDLKEQYGIVLRSVTEPIDTASPMGGMIFAILASFAAEERRVITGRTLAG